MKLIDKDAFKTRLEHEAWSRGHVELLRAKDIADETPTIEERKTGRWIFNQYDANPQIGNWHCSECGQITIMPHDVCNYCPNCGAKMDAERKEE